MTDQHTIDPEAGADPETSPGPGTNEPVRHRRRERRAHRKPTVPDVLRVVTTIIVGTLLGGQLAVSWAVIGETANTSAQMRVTDDTVMSENSSAAARELFTHPMFDTKDWDRFQTGLTAQRETFRDDQILTVNDTVNNLPWLPGAGPVTRTLALATVDELPDTDEYTYGTAYFVASAFCERLGNVHDTEELLTEFEWQYDFDTEQNMVNRILYWAAPDTCAPVLKNPVEQP